VNGIPILVRTMDSVMPGSPSLGNPGIYSSGIVMSWKWCHLLLHMFSSALAALPIPSHRVVYVAILESFQATNHG
jgi:hypothetical protein